ncbi:hypothetical protein SanaruYs_20610 [Chryseotalea sanaruensis]|uniref:DHCW motif cupin fold protein n=1 Tax=Chryseotalea sanaruensis TaxID=2482724 RepID=A0A401UAD2_9BACT|nr:DHCW motif cupin fold protein [Chryseotalea sanaruensis]GCC51832.1 hypothetical protein SanaruYs_20610 [Chryseotalea sanaruensis]
MSHILFQTLNWSTIPKIEYPGEHGTSFAQTMQFEGLRLRIVAYKKGYLADHWCEKGHIVHCLQGEFIIELGNMEKITFSQGMSFVVSDDLSSHRAFSENGAKLFIVDGDFLKS